MEQRLETWMRRSRGPARWARGLLLALLLCGACVGGQSGTETPVGDDDPFDIQIAPEDGGPAPDGGLGTDCEFVDPGNDVSPACAGEEDGGTQ